MIQMIQNLFVKKKNIKIIQHSKKRMIVKDKDKKYRYEWVEIDGKKNGIYKKWNIEHNILCVQCNYTNDVLNGKYEAWFDTEKFEYEDRIFHTSVGNIKFVCNFKDGKLHGEYIQYFYYKDGEVEVECNFKNGKLHGLYKDWAAYSESSESGKRLSEEINYVDGKRDGFSKYWHDGELIEESQYSNGKIEGIYISKWPWWYANYTRIDCEIRNDVIQYYYEYNFKNKKIFEYERKENPLTYKEWCQDDGVMSIKDFDTNFFIKRIDDSMQYNRHEYGYTTLFYETDL